MNPRKILIIGPVAPPFGGVSIHISRLAGLLKNHFSIGFIDESRVRKEAYFNIRSLRLSGYFKKIKNADLLYIHSGKASLRIFHLITGKLLKKKMILTIHSFPAKTLQPLRYVNGWMYRLADTIILVNPDLQIRLGLPGKKIIVKEAFIPPEIEGEPELPERVEQWIGKNKKEGNAILCANASTLALHQNEDVYGLDLCIEVTRRLIEKNIPVCFIFVVSSTERNRHIFIKNQQLIEQLKLKEKFFLINEKLSFVKLIRLSDIVIRPTNTDGDALTIREALFFRKPVITSDVVKRPGNVFLFKNRDIEDLQLKLEKLLEKGSSCIGAEAGGREMQDLNTFYTQLIEKTFTQRKIASYSTEEFST